MTNIPHPDRHQAPHRAAASGVAGYRAGIDDVFYAMEIEEAAPEHGRDSRSGAASAGGMMPPMMGLGRGGAAGPTGAPGATGGVLPLRAAGARGIDPAAGLPWRPGDLGYPGSDGGSNPPRQGYYPPARSVESPGSGGYHGSPAIGDGGYNPPGSGGSGSPGGSGYSPSGGGDSDDADGGDGVVRVGPADLDRARADWARLGAELARVQAEVEQLRLQNSGFFLGSLPHVREGGQDTFVKDSGNMANMSDALGQSSTDYRDVEQDATAAARGVDR